MEVEAKGGPSSERQRASIAERAAVSEEAEVTDAHQALGQNME